MEMLLAKQWVRVKCNAWSHWVQRLMESTFELRYGATKLRFFNCNESFSFR